MNDKSIVTQNDLNKSKVTLGAMQISLHTNPFETTTNKCGIELGREERVRTYKLGLEGGLWSSDSKRSSFTPSSKSFDFAMLLRLKCSGFLFLIVFSKPSTSFRASSASLIHASITKLWLAISPSLYLSLSLFKTMTMLSVINNILCEQNS